MEKPKGTSRSVVEYVLHIKMQYACYNCHGIFSTLSITFHQLRWNVVFCLWLRNMIEALILVVQSRYKKKNVPATRDAFIFAIDILSALIRIWLAAYALTTLRVHHFEIWHFSLATRSDRALDLHFSETDSAVMNIDFSFIEQCPWVLSNRLVFYDCNLPLLTNASRNMKHLILAWLSPVLVSDGNALYRHRTVDYLHSFLLNSCVCCYERTVSWMYTSTPLWLCHVGTSWLMLTFDNVRIEWQIRKSCHCENISLSSETFPSRSRTSCCNLNE